MAKRIIIVGGGLSGTLLALQLAGNKNAEIILLEKNPQMLGRGVAYNYDFTHQPLNVPASGMSLYADEPDHFVHWIQQNAFRYNHLLDSVSPDAFVPRKIFGDYIVEHLQKAHHEQAASFQIRIDEVLSIKRSGAKLEATLESGIQLEADHLVLALGNFPPGDLFPDNTEVINAQGYFPNPWTDRVYSHLSGNENILLVGTGLTAVDVVLGLKTRNFKGTISMLSRRGKLPLPHDLSQPPVEIADPGYLTPRDALRWLTKEIRTRSNTPWTAVMDGIRPHTQNIWKRWSWDEKKYFMRRLRPIWEVVRHRIPAQSAALLSEMVSAGQLHIGKAKIHSAKMHADGIEVFWNDDNGTHSGVFQKVINCTGPESNYRKVKLPVLADLVAQGLLVNDPIGLGILCTEDGNILDKDNRPVNGLWCMGPMRKAVLWETTAIRELRAQAKELAELVTA
jgi:uncharacterized NAD(P)/FAD-binding protein YdhS